MKTRNSSLAKRAMLTLLICVNIAIQGVAQPIPKEYSGAWETGLTKLTVREKIKFMKYRFTSCQVIIALNIDAENRISGRIGDAKFTNATMKKNKGNPEVTGIAYIINCGAIGKIESTDPIESKTIELWVKPIKHSGEMMVEIRLRDGWDTFPMGEGLLTNKN